MEYCHVTKHYRENPSPYNSISREPDNLAEQSTHNVRYYSKGQYHRPTHDSEYPTAISLRWARKTDLE